MLLLSLLAYFLGSLPFAVITSKIFHLQDPRTFGSGNPGATNVLRTGNKFAALLTLLGDALKGTAAIYCARLYGIDTLEALSWIGLAAFLGHVFPVFLKFKGGKGVSTALGVLLGLSPMLALACLGSWITIALLSRYSSLAALVAASLSPVFAYYLNFPSLSLISLSLMSAILIFRHHANITRLLKGEESKIMQKNKIRKNTPAS